jgi:hypothetical protein
VHSAELLCGFWPAETTYDGSVALEICPSAVGFAIFHHELGHVLNIRPHASDRAAVMSNGRSAGDIIDEDRRLFAEANPGFVGLEGGHQVRWLGRVERAPQLLRVGDRLLGLIPQSDRTRLVQLSLDSGLPIGPEMSLDLPPGEETVVFPSGSGMGLIWTELGRAFLMRLDGQSLTPSSAAVLPLAGLGATRSITAAAEVGGALFALVHDEQRGSVELYRADRQSSGGGAALLLDEQGVEAAQLIGKEAGLVLVTVSTDGSASLRELGLDGSPVAAMVLPGETWKETVAEQVPALAVSTQGELVVASNRFVVREEVQPPHAPVRRIYTEILWVDPRQTPPSLKLQLIELPTQVNPTAPLQLSPAPGGMVAVVTGSLALSDVSETRDVYVALLTGGTVPANWQRLSAPQGEWSFAGRVGTVGGKGVALWYDGSLRTGAEAKARCFTF